MIGSTLGLGGGMVLVHVWQEKLQLNVQRTTGSICLILMSVSFTSFVQSLIGGSYKIEEILMFGSVSFISSYLISSYIKYQVNKYKK